MISRITIVHPSRCRPQRCLQTINNWINKASKKTNILYIISVDTDDPYIEEYKKVHSELEISNPNIVFVIIILENKSCIEAINNATKVLPTEKENDLIVVVSDDFDCFENWDDFLLSNLIDKEDFIVKTSDGIQDWIITLPIMDRKYYNRFGYVYYPEYKHMFCDTEMTSVGHLLNRVIDLKSSTNVFRHLHYTIGLSQKDDINKKNDDTWNQGEALYYERKKNNFNLDL